MNNKILIIGSDSVIGGYFSNYLEKKNYNVIKFYLPKEKYNEYGYRLFLSVLEKEQPEYVVNFLGMFNGDENTMFHVNTQLPVELMIAIKDKNISTRFVLIGSASEYGRNSDYKEGGIFNPSSFYGITKYLQFVSFKKISQMYELNGVYARIFNVMSVNVSRVLFPGAFAESLVEYLRGESDFIKVGNIDIIRDYLILGDLSVLLESVMIKGGSGEDYNICSGYGVNIKEFVFNVLEELGIDGNKIQYTDSANSVGNANNDVIGNANKVQKISPSLEDNMIKRMVEDYVKGIKELLGGRK